jgi:DNA-binding transcriptional LysR family regulator
MSIPATVLLQRLLARGKFRHVQVLLRLAELGSVQRTATAIGLTQSSVTQTLAYLERLLELQLFDRHARGVRPTAGCRQLLPVMHQLMADLAQGADIASSGHLRGQQQLRVLASVSAAHGLLLAALNTFHDQYPLVRVQLGEAEGADQLLSVARGEVDLVACRQPAVLPQGWVFEPLVDDELVVVCGPQHPLAQRAHLCWADLADQPWQLGPVGSIARTRLDELAQRFAAGVKTFPLVSRMPAALAGALRQRPVLGFLPLSYLRHLVDAREVIVLPLDERFPIDPLGVMVPADARSEAAERLRAHVRLHCQPPVNNAG